MNATLTLRYGQAIVVLKDITPAWLEELFYESNTFLDEIDGPVVSFIESASGFYNLNKKNPNGVMIHLEVNQHKYDREYTDIKSKWIGFPMKETFQQICDEFKGMLECPK